MNLINKTKLVITSGPSTDKMFGIDKVNLTFPNTKEVADNFLAFVDAGVNVMRFNLSHETPAVHEVRYNFIQEQNKKNLKPIAVLFDTKGPEIRVNKIQEEVLEDNLINLHDEVLVSCLTPDLVGTGKHFNVSDSTKKYNMAVDLKLGQKIYLDDGKLILEVVELDKEKGLIKTKSLSDNYYIKTNKRINLTDTNYSLPFLSDYDKECIQLASKLNVEYLALSFASRVEDIKEVREILAKTNPKNQVKIIAKIESYEAVQNLEALVEECDGIMVARGDLALEIGFEKVPYYQDEIIRLCTKHHKIVIVATQMLDSLEKNHLPTRAEVTDCYYAAKSLADSTMLSGESASGHDPINAVKQMKFITDAAEKYNRQCTKDIYPDFKLEEGTEELALLRKIKSHCHDKEVVILKNFSDADLALISKVNYSTKFIILVDRKDMNWSQALLRNITVLNLDNFNKLEHEFKNCFVLDKHLI